MTIATETLRTAPLRAPDPSDPIPFARLVRVEWSKATDTRAARWLLGLVGSLTVAVLAVPLAFPRVFDQTLQAFLEIGSIALLVLLPVVAILTLTSEWSQHTALATFTQEPRRARVVGAKLVVATVLGVLGAAFAFAASYLALLVADLIGRDVAWESPPWRVVVGFVLVSVLNTLMGAAFGALLYNTAAAIVLFFVLPTVWGVLAFGVFERLGRWLDTAQTWGWLAAGDWDGHVGPILVSTAFWVLLPLAAGVARTVRREVK